MAKNYKHITKDQECNAAQYIAEFVCLRKAEKENVGRPAYALWNTKSWKRYYQYQVGYAYKLLKEFSDQAILRALKSSTGSWMYSLNMKKLKPLIKNEQKKIDEAPKPKQVEYTKDTKSQPQKRFSKNKDINLRDLDG
tara:strand:+ start:784 stop:1197 length:414 start_codon:yes stop_codon:yes gene_type:complete